MSRSLLPHHHLLVEHTSFTGDDAEREWETSMLRIDWPGGSRPSMGNGAPGPFPRTNLSHQCHIEVENTHIFTGRHTIGIKKDGPATFAGHILFFVLACLLGEAYAFFAFVSNQYLWGLRFAKQSRQYTGRSPEGLKGTSASCPHSEHVTLCISRSPYIPFPPFVYSHSADEGWRKNAR